MGNQYEMRAPGALPHPSEPAPEALTTRQLEVLQLLCQGLQNKQIARRLNIASATVKIHVANILRALNVSSRLQAAVVAINLGVNQRWGGCPAASPQATVTPPRQTAILRLVPGDDDASSVRSPRRDWSLEAAAG